MDTHHRFNEKFLWLEAVNAGRNIARRYTIAVSCDLFGIWIVSFSWGRIGMRGQCRTVSFAMSDEADRFVRTLLRRRASARQRIGVAYREVHSGEPVDLTSTN